MSKVKYQNKVCATCNYRAQVSTKKPCTTCIPSHPANYPRWEPVEYSKPQKQITKNRCSLCAKQESIDCIICDGSYFTPTDTKASVKTGNPNKMFGPNVVKHNKIDRFLDEEEEKRQCHDLGIEPRGKYDDIRM